MIQADTYVIGKKYRIKIIAFCIQYLCITVPSLLLVLFTYDHPMFTFLGKNDDSEEFKE